MKPEIYIEIAGFVLNFKSYALFAWLGAISATIIAFPLLKRKGLSTIQSSILLLTMMMSFLVCARLFNYFINPDAYYKNLKIYSFRLVGLSFYGGVLGAFFVLLFYSRIAKNSIWPLLDALVLPTGISFAFARIGCFLNGCCRGIITESFLGVNFPLSKAEEIALKNVSTLFKIPLPKVLHYPTQLFELAFALLALILVLWLSFKKRLPTGGAFLLYGILFSTMRLLILPIRILPYNPIITNVFYPAFYLSLIISGILYFAYISKKNV